MAVNNDTDLLVLIVLVVIAAIFLSVLSIVCWTCTHMRRRGTARPGHANADQSHNSSRESSFRPMTSVDGAQHDYVELHASQAVFWGAQASNQRQGARAAQATDAEPTLHQIQPVIRWEDTALLAGTDLAPTEDGSELCSICLDSVAPGDDQRTVLCRMLPCGHVFHQHCVDPWLFMRHTCPLCKMDMTLAAETSKP